MGAGPWQKPEGRAVQLRSIGNECNAKEMKVVVGAPLTHSLLLGIDVWVSVCL